MKLVQQSSSQLTLRLIPVWLWIFGGIFAAVGFFVIAIFGNDTSLTVQQDDRLFRYTFGGSFIIVGFFTAGYVAQVVTCRFDKTLGSFILKRQGLFSTKLIEHRI